ncbi:WXG100 family type VII secretion target [Aeromicrobium stalagmiti]|uniref:WXG100 family type VII secretion target n=1 Tax=Aeromicrobium stalagmiti TaxID=2738988 RepID=UPI0015692BED|nr:hypothetical protein [Aeromicrobium stalagmiti]NRQ50116.1 hypothetical protein [Aeromicrobium stalagmiti]
MGFGDDLLAAGEDALDETIENLRSVLARLENIDFFPPWDAAQTIVDAVATAIEVATTPPDPDPVDVEAAADAWGSIATSVDRGAVDLTRSQQAMTVQVWEGDAGNAARIHLGQLTDRVETVTTAAEKVRGALITVSDDMTAARERHGSAYSILTEHLDISWGDMFPWELVSKLKNIVGDCIDAVEALIGSYQDAASTVATARRLIVAAIDAIELPAHLPDGVSPASVVNAWDGDESGALRGSVLERADDALDDMSAKDRTAAQQLLDGADGDEEKAWILAAIASGLKGSDLDKYAGQLATMTPEQIDALDPGTADDGTYTQPDQTTCGSSTLVMSKMLNDPAYAMYIATGHHPVTGETSDLSPSELFDQESLDMHEQTNGLTDHDDDLQVPWPGPFGTSPSGVIHQMGGDGGSGIPGSTYDTDLTDPSSPAADYDSIVAATQDGETVPLYVGDEKIPRHVVLVTSSSDDSLTIYEPSAGETITVSRDDFENGTVDVAGWTKPWLAVTPS